MGNALAAVPEIAFLAGFAAALNALLASVCGWLSVRLGRWRWVGVSLGLVVVCVWAVVASWPGQNSEMNGAPAMWVPIGLAFVIPQALAIAVARRPLYVHALFAAAAGVVGALVYWLVVVPAFP